MLITYQYRIFPSESQIHNLAIHFGHNRYIWNEAIRFIQNENNGKYTSRNKRIRIGKRKRSLYWFDTIY